jgi:hypothetical protein
MSSLSERINQIETDQTEADEVRRLAANQRGTYEQLLQEERDRVAHLERELGIASKIGQINGPPGWLKLAGKKNPKRHRATPWLLLSDLHLDEVVQPAELMGMNSYNRTIAEMRLKETIEGAATICQQYWTGIDYDGIVVALAGDNFSGNIHEELQETNEDTILGSVDHWIGRLADSLSFLADEFGKVHVPVVVGNHGRLTRKPRAKLRTRDNYDWFLGMALQRIFASDPRITFDVSASPDAMVPAYGETVLVTHGDQTSGGAGIGGIWPPIMRLDARKSQRQAAVNRPYDLMVMGHWHQLVFGPKFIVNGSLKGYDEYAFTSNFGFEAPQQALWLMTPEHGKTWTAPVLSQNREAEGW